MAKTKIENIKNGWKRMSFKGNKVWVATTPDGLLLEKKDKVLIKYNLKQDYEYWIKSEGLKPLDQAVPAGKKKNKPLAKNSSINLNITAKIPDNCIQIYTDGASDFTKHRGSHQQCGRVVCHKSCN